MTLELAKDVSVACQAVVNFFNSALPGDMPCEQKSIISHTKNEARCPSWQGIRDITQHRERNIIAF